METHSEHRRRGAPVIFSFSRERTHFRSARKRMNERIHPTGRPGPLRRPVATPRRYRSIGRSPCGGRNSYFIAVIYGTGRERERERALPARAGSHSGAPFRHDIPVSSRRGEPHPTVIAVIAPTSESLSVYLSVLCLYCARRVRRRIFHLPSRCHPADVNPGG